MKRILLIGATTGYQTRSFAETAARLGFDLLLATDRCHILDDPWGDHALPLRFEDPENAARRLAEEQHVDGIVALGDRAAVLAAIAAERLGIPYNSRDVVAACRNKFLARQRFQTAGLLVPDYRKIPVSEVPIADQDYPCVLKPLGLSASRGVIRANNPEEFAAAFGRIRKLLNDPDIVRLRESQDEFIQVERFIEGREFALEGILSEGELQVLAIFDKPDPLDGPFFEETIYTTPSRAERNTQQAIIETTQAAVRALGLRRGPVHAEMRVNGAGVWMLEVAARPIGGLCSRVIPGLEELILRHAAGEDVSNFRLDERAAGVMMIPIPRAGIYVAAHCVERAREVALIEDVMITAKLGQRLIPLPEGNSYLGFIFARGGSPDHVERALRDSHARLRFEIAPTLPVV